ncbi:hypothetical protein MRX96_013007 [Rhipicephalus microplus]
MNRPEMPLRSPAPRRSSEGERVSTAGTIHENGATPHGPCRGVHSATCRSLYSDGQFASSSVTEKPLSCSAFEPVRGSRLQERAMHQHFTALFRLTALEGVRERKEERFSEGLTVRARGKA